MTKERSEKDGICETCSIHNTSCGYEHRLSLDRLAVDNGCNFTCRIYRTWRGVRRMDSIIIGILTVAALAFIGMLSVAIAMAVITWEEWDE